MKRFLRPILIALAALVACMAFGWQLSLISERMAGPSGKPPTVRP